MKLLQHKTKCTSAVIPVQPSNKPTALVRKTKKVSQKSSVKLLMMKGSFELEMCGGYATVFLLWMS